MKINKNIGMLLIIIVGFFIYLFYAFYNADVLIPSGCDGGFEYNRLTEQVENEIITTKEEAYDALDIVLDLSSQRFTLDKFKHGEISLVGGEKIDAWYFNEGGAVTSNGTLYTYKSCE